jgi:hypothetical protein
VEALMAQLKIISETGMFHSACHCTFANPTRSEWYGFLPKVHRRPVSDGQVDRADRTSNINHYVLFDIADVTLDRAIRQTVAAYSEKDYILGVCDCVSFSADLAWRCNLKVPVLNMTPYGFIKVLAWKNAYVQFS